ncbi:MAG: HAD-IC family P-type ATPase [Cellvibrio sp.]|uniref:cation-translocating P-type ATPase n=1 Tax=Cellvibrio sp. TaxID=1965322 RepID=UPI002723368D|nr:HAD-IC family P-type ATPase [Cellvibrio sp.]
MHNITDSVAADSLLLKDPPLLDGAHAQTPEQLLTALNGIVAGLTEAESTTRRLRWGDNQLPVTPPTPAWRRWLRQFHNLFIYVLLISATISLVLQHWVDTGVILAVILVNAAIGYVQEGKAEAALRAIMSLSKSLSMVVRNGAGFSIDSSQLVPGDVVMLQAGDKVPADLRLIECKELRCDEALLTGESQSAAKTTATLPPETLLAERRNMAYMGTLVTQGTARGLVINTGIRTEIGAINQLVQLVKTTATPLQLQLGKLAQQLTIAILVLTIATMAFGILVRDYTLAQMFQAAIGIAVAAIPEGLPAIVTIALALGVGRMAAEHALVRRLPAVEVLGSVDVICTDKTGTLTANAMTARQLVTTNNHYLISGEGYEPRGNFRRKGERQPIALEALGEDPQLVHACRIALVCNDANLTHDNNRWQLHGDPTEGALHVMALKSGLTNKQSKQQWPRLDELPFESEKRYMAVLHRFDNSTGDNLGNDAQAMAVKGAPDRLLELCQWQLGESGNEPLDKAYWHQQLTDLAAQGMRVLALACKTHPDDQPSLTHKHMHEGLVMVALAGLSDPPRPEAIAAIDACHSAGIRVMMITGDNPVTAAAIGKELGLNAKRVMTGAELDLLSPADFSQIAETVDIFARTSPANKLQLVEALQTRHHTVAMTGDGVNDAPALRTADIGIAMGMKGTDAAREASAFVLTDDNFATIEQAVAEGRTIYDNIVKSIAFILPTDLAEASIIILAILFGWMLPITPAQILWVNTITAVTLALALVFERSEANIMARPPRQRHQGLITAALLYRILLVGGLGAATVFVLFRWKLDQGASIEQARAIAVNALVIFECFYLLTARTFYDSIWHPRYWQGIGPSLLAIIVVVIFQLLFTYLPLSQTIFAVAGISLEDWLIIALATSPIVLLVETEKVVARRMQARRQIATQGKRYAQL